MKQFKNNLKKIIFYLIINKLMLSGRNQYHYFSKLLIKK